MKIIIYALGRVFHNFRDKIDWDNIAALADRNVRDIQEMNGVPVISPDRICGMDYDYVAIFSSKLFEAIKVDLVGEYFVPADKVISWKALTDSKPEDDIVKYYRNFSLRKHCKKILDLGMSMVAKFYLTKDELFPEKGVFLDGVCGQYYLHGVNLYDCVYKDYKECKENYDAIWLWDDERTDTEWKEVCGRAKYILLLTRYLVKGVEEKLRKYGKVYSIANADGVLWILEPQNQEDAKVKVVNGAIYVVLHKKYNVRQDVFYKPLCVGEYRQEGFMSELVGDNIAFLNGKINECTALYWIWKNTDDKYVGMNHYRRFFYNDGSESLDNYLEWEYAHEILQGYDIILPIPCSFGNMTVYEQLHNSIEHALCERAYSVVREEIKEKQPNYVEAFDSVMDAHCFFPCNIFVTKREILNQYCEWLFSFLIDAAEKVNVEGYDSYSRRAVGFFAERMWTVWLRRNKVKIKELPYTAQWGK